MSKIEHMINVEKASREDLIETIRTYRLLGLPAFIGFSIVCIGEIILLGWSIVAYNEALGTETTVNTIGSVLVNPGTWAFSIIGALFCSAFMIGSLILGYHYVCEWLFKHKVYLKWFMDKADYQELVVEKAK
jgi:hypothetical protein